MEEQSMKTVPPDAERVLVGSLLRKPNSLRVSRLTVHPQDLQDPSAREVYKTLLEMDDTDKMICPETVVTEMVACGSQTDPSVLAIIIEGMIRLAKDDIDGITAYVKGSAARREVSATLSRGLQAVDATGDDLNSIVFGMAQDMNRVLAEIAESDIRMTSEGAMGVVEDSKKTQVSGIMPGMPSGFKNLDDVLSGLMPGDLTLIAARPSTGKSALMQCMINEVMDKDPKRMLLFTPEMTYNEVVLRFLSMRSGIDSKKIRNGEIDSTDLGVLTQCVKEIEAWPLAINDKGGIHIGKLVTIASKHKDRYPDLEYVFVDYLQLVNGYAGRKSDSRNDEVSRISSALKQMGKDLGVTVVALSQLSRRITHEKNPRLPDLSDLRDSGSLEQDADKVMFVHRLGNNESSDLSVDVDAWILVRKNRTGPIGWTHMKFTRPTTRFSDIPITQWISPEKGR
jgi:replicative DNA helicase